MDKFTDINASRMLRDLILTFVDTIIFYRRFVTKITEKNNMKKKKKKGKRMPSAESRTCRNHVCMCKAIQYIVHFSIHFYSLAQMADGFI